MNDKNALTKVIVLGDSGVGKSSLLLRFVNDEFNQFNDPTQGASYLSKTHQYQPSKTIKYEIWDTAGQEKYKSIASIYYRDSQVALCVYDITSKNSFKVLKDWVEELQHKGPKNIIMVIIGNKVDLADQEEVSYSEVKNYANSLGAMYKLTSAKDGKGVNELFTAIAEHIQKKSMVINRQTIQLGANDSKNENAKEKRKRKCC